METKLVKIEITVRRKRKNNPTNLNLPLKARS